MDVRRFEQKVWMVRLPGEPQLRPELALLRRRITDTDAVNLVLDLSRVEIMGSRSLGMLLRLHRLLSEKGRRLILCHARPTMKGVFRLTGLEDVFDFAADKSDALDILRQFPPPADEFPPEEDARPRL
jgi:anti-anti-sigma factor